MAEANKSTKVSLSDRQQLRVGEVLVSGGLATDQEIESALKEQEKDRSKRLGEVLVDMGVVDEAGIAKAVAERLGLQFVDLAEEKVESSALNDVPSELITQHQLFPIRSDDSSLTIATSDPLSAKTAAVLDSVESISSKTVIEVVAMPQQLQYCIREFQAREQSKPPQIKEVKKPEKVDTDSFIRSLESSDPGDQYQIEDSIVVKLVNRILGDAIKDRASDIHLEPYGKQGEIVVRFRIDGKLTDYRHLPSEYRNSIVSRLKIMARLDIAERRLPQDGKFRFKNENHEIELRMATIPTAGDNEDVVMRILAGSGALPLTAMGLSERNLEEIKNLVRQPYGLLLAVGPTGSGKTTTLHSMLGEINEVERKIWTVEDPVEITQHGLRQLQVQPNIGLTFAAAMRSFLRADPDVIMVGEMRDEETAAMGIEASLTGHMVLSTLHTNTAPETVTRLIDMGLEPFSFSDALTGILSQRLARKLCDRCKLQNEATSTEVEKFVEILGQEVVSKLTDSESLVLWRSHGCNECSGTGYHGRIALHELLVNNDNIRVAIQQRETTAAIRELAQQSGMTTLLQDGAAKCIKGSTDLKQVLTVCSR